MLWQPDMLCILKDLADRVVWKGGTCVQSYPEPTYRRYSVDLDLNVSLDRSGVVDAANRVNEELIRRGKPFEVGGFGSPHSSQSDLIADKLVAMPEVQGVRRGRLLLKDACDIVALLNAGGPRAGRR